MSWTSRVRRYPRACSDIELQVDYYLLVKGVPDVALHFLDAVEAGLGFLVAHPEAGVLWRVSSSEELLIRRWAVPGFPNHLLFYRATPEGLDLVRVIHGARDLGSALGETHTPE